MNFFIDPYIFAFDKDTFTKEQLEEFINNLIDWKKLIDLNWGRVYKPTDTFDILFKYKLYPLVDGLKELVNKYNIDYIQPEEIDKIVNSVLNKLPTIEDYSGINDILIDTDNLNIQSNRNDDFIHILKKLVTILKMDCIINKKRDNGQILLSKELDSPLIKFDALISIIDANHNIDLPIALNIEFNHFANFKEFCTKIEPAIIWINAQNDLCIRMAVYIKVFQHDETMDYINKANTPNFILYDSFFKSMRDLNFHTDEAKIDNLLRALFEEILHLNMKDTHELRVSKSGGAKQIEYNKYTGWRRDIDYEYHLHYWKRGENLIFTDVVSHNNYDITKFN
ncbi:MAG TPA: hypothetical protein VMV32_01145 [Ignavibacteriaceae bacterium]|nr:hypothetical protein [Ignavibacteriaceae bacterium]